MIVRRWTLNGTNIHASILQLERRTVVFLLPIALLHSTDCVVGPKEYSSDLVDVPVPVFEMGRKELKIERDVIVDPLSRITTHLALHNEPLFLQVSQYPANAHEGIESVDSFSQPHIKPRCFISIMFR
tara:strand:- start:25 stop:408 length:384 start_codon:yes stop_codon:yes gene_type:complete